MEEGVRIGNSERKSNKSIHMVHKWQGTVVLEIDLHGLRSRSKLINGC